MSITAGWSLIGIAIAFGLARLSMIWTTGHETWGFLLLVSAAICFVTGIICLLRPLFNRIGSNRFTSIDTERGQIIPQARLFRSRGFAWPLTDDFWRLAPTFDPEHARENGDGGMMGPLCPSCRVDVSDDLKYLVPEKRSCFHCGNPLPNPFIDMREAHPLLPLRRAAYREAQAAMRRGEVVRIE